MTETLELGCDNAALTTLLADALGDPTLRIQRVERLSGGAVQENWLLEVGHAHTDERLVLRTDAPATIAASLDRLQEYQVLRAADDAGVAVPKPILACDDARVIGRSFYVMRWVPGDAGAPRVIKQTEHGEALAQALGSELAKLHRVVPPVRELAFLEMPELPVSLTRVQRYRDYLDALGQAQPTLEWALRWLERRATDDIRVVLCHGDYRTGNYLVHDGRLSAILDWEFAGWGHPYEDIGWFCARCWRFSRPDRDAGGIASREDLYSGYEREAGHAITRSAIAYWEIMATVRWAIIALQQGERHMSGDQRSLELALTARLLPELELDLLNQIEAADRAGVRP